MKLQHKILLSVSCIVIIVVLTVSGVGYYNAQKQLQASVEEQMNAVARTYVSEVDSWVHGKKRSSRLLERCWNHMDRRQLSPCSPSEEVIKKLPLFS
jgi:sensor histidine kinase regulating citrate/malate metabolism